MMLIVNYYVSRDSLFNVVVFTNPIQVGAGNKRRFMSLYIFNCLLLQSHLWVHIKFAKLMASTTTYNQRPKFCAITHNNNLLQ